MNSILVNKDVIAMRKYTLYIYICLMTSLGWLAGKNAQAQSDEPGTWARGAGGELMDLANSVSTDDAGNTYITGGFQNVSHFGDRKVQANGDADIFIAKYDNTGTPLWVKSVGSDTVLNNALSEYGTDVVVHHDHLYVTGVFSGTANFNGTMIRSQGSGDVFLAKYTLQGELVWVRSAGGINQDIARAITTDEYGNIYVTGLFQDIGRFDQYTATALNSTAFFLAKYDANGNVQWVRQSSGNRATEGKDVIVKGDHCLVIGNFESQTSFDGTTLNTQQQSVFMNRYTLAGDLKSARSLAEGTMLSAEGFYADKRAIYVAGSVYGQLLAGSKTYDGAGSVDGFLMKTDNQGNIQWVKTIGGPGMDVAKKVFATDDKQIVLGGTFNAYMKVDTSLVTTTGGDDIFIASYSAQGHVNWVDHLGGEAQDQLSDMTVRAGQVTLTGHFAGIFSHRGQRQEIAGQTDALLVRMALRGATAYTPESVDEGVAFYPNPASETITVESADALNAIVIADISGRLVKEIELDGVYRVQVSVREIPVGLYVIKANSSKGIRTSKLIIKR